MKVFLADGALFIGRIRLMTGVELWSWLYPRGMCSLESPLSLEKYIVNNYCRNVKSAYKCHQPLPHFFGIIPALKQIIHNIQLIRSTCFKFYNCISYLV
jgi:hypothetical protein